MAITNVFGYFYQVGSSDVPSNMSLDSPFGFDQGSTTPIFSYTLNDVSLAFESAQSLSKEGYIYSDRLSTLLVESLSTPEIKDVDVDDPYWSAAFRVLEYLYNNQTTFIQSATSANYLNKGDQELGSETIDGNPNPFYVNQYVVKSIAYESSIFPGRVRYVSFQIRFSDRVVTFTIYMEADSFVERSDGIRYYVYRYIDSPPEDNIITNVEFKERIINIVFNILKEGKYNSYGELIVSKRTGENTYVDEQFFVFSSLNTVLTEDQKRLQIKKYLLDYYGQDTVSLQYDYPSLFDETTVLIIPMYGNKMLTEGSLEIDLHMLSIPVLQNTLSSFGFNISQSSTAYRPVEIFHLGAGTGFIPTNGSEPRYRFPLLAIEQDPESVVLNPIASRFINYVPIYGSIGDNDFDTFHAVLLAILDFLTGVSAVIDSTLITQYSIQTYAPDVDHYNRRYTTFNMNGAMWLVYGPVSQP